MNLHVRRILTGLAVVAFVSCAGAFWLFELGAGRWSFSESAYMSVISAATVGFSELPDMDKVPGARTATIVIIFLGIAAFAYAQSSLTAFLLEGVLTEALRRRRMVSQIEKLDGHVVVAGAGATGRHVVEELAATGRDFVVIDRDRHHLERLSEDLKRKVLFVQGDATEDHTLLAAGIERASGVVAALTHDRDNLYVTLSARTLNAKARIVSKVVESEAAPKMLRAGANATVSPNSIGGLRLASELLRPNVVEFLDTMLRDKSRNLRFEEVELPAASPLAGRSLADSRLREHTNTLVVATRKAGAPLTYNPAATLRLEAGTTLVVLAEAADVQRLRDYVTTGKPAK